MACVMYGEKKEFYAELEKLDSLQAERWQEARHRPSPTLAYLPILSQVGEAAIKVFERAPRSDDNT